MPGCLIYSHSTANMLGKWRKCSWLDVAGRVKTMKNTIIYNLLSEEFYFFAERLNKLI
ncbi:MAG: hypothetical protein AB2803_09490 [Candidatus Thiodiazotropha sp.]